jgi:hypothetical protein
MPVGSITVTSGGAVVPALRQRYSAPTMTLLKRLVSPAGFALALLFFLFPFSAVSCEAPDLGSVEITYTGVDYATGGDPDVETVGDFGREAGDPVADNENPPEPDVAPLTLITLVVILCGLATVLLPTARLRLSVSVGAAALSAALLVVTQILATGNLESSLIDTARDVGTGPGEEPFTLTESIADDMVDTRIGFWLSLVALVLVLLFQAATAVRERSRR